MQDTNNNLPSLKITIDTYKTISQAKNAFKWLRPNKAMDSFALLGWKDRKSDEQIITKTYQNITKTAQKNFEALKELVEQGAVTEFGAIESEINRIESYIKNKKIQQFDKKCAQIANPQDSSNFGSSLIQKAIGEVKEAIQKYKNLHPQDDEEDFVMVEISDDETTTIPVEENFSKSGLFNRAVVTGPSILNKTSARTATFFNKTLSFMHFQKERGLPEKSFKLGSSVMLNTPLENSLREINSPSSELSPITVKEFMNCITAISQQSSNESKLSTIDSFYLNKGITSRSSKDLKEILEQHKNLEKPILIPIFLPKTKLLGSDHFVTIFIDKEKIEYFDPKAVNASARDLSDQLGTMADVLEVCKKVFYEEDQELSFFENLKPIQKDTNNSGVFACLFAFNKINNTPLTEILDHLSDNTSNLLSTFRETMVEIIADTVEELHLDAPTEYKHHQDYIDSLTGHWQCNFTDLHFGEPREIPPLEGFEKPELSVNRHLELNTFESDKDLINQLKKDAHRQQPIKTVDPKTDKVTQHPYDFNAESMNEIIPNEVREYLNNDPQLLRTFVNLSTQGARLPATTPLTMYHLTNGGSLNGDNKALSVEGFVGESITLSKNLNNEIIMKVIRRYDLIPNLQVSSDPSIAVDITETYNLSNPNEVGICRYREISKKGTSSKI